MSASPVSRSAPRAPARKPAAAPVATGTACAGTSLDQCVVHNLDQYFAALDGAKPHALHELVMQAVERPLLQYAMARSGGNQSAAAELLGINRNTLRKKLTDYKLG
jgi:Fis family transcriptional regulator